MFPLVFAPLALPLVLSAVSRLHLLAAPQPDRPAQDVFDIDQLRSTLAELATFERMAVRGDDTAEERRVKRIRRRTDPHVSVSVPESISDRAALDLLRSRPVVLVGDTHPNPVIARRAEAALRAVLGAGDHPRVALILEMIPVSKQRALDVAIDRLSSGDSRPLRELLAAYRPYPLRDLISLIDACRVGGGEVLASSIARDYRSLAVDIPDGDRRDDHPFVVEHRDLSSGRDLRAEELAANRTVAKLVGDRLGDRSARLSQVWVFYGIGHVFGNGCLRELLATDGLASVVLLPETLVLDEVLLQRGGPQELGRWHLLEDGVLRPPAGSLAEYEEVLRTYRSW